MALSTITHTVLDGAENPVGSGYTVEALLMPSNAFRLSDSSGVARRGVSTTTDSSGHFSLALEQQANIISPAGTWWQITIKLPQTYGGTQVYAISVGATDATLLASLVSPSFSSGLSQYITQSTGDARYARLGTGAAGLGVSVMDAPYSAVGDNTIDDTAAINAAIAAVNAAGGGLVRFPAGYTFKCATGINLNGMRSVILQGASAGDGGKPTSKLNFTGTSGARFIDARDGRSIGIEHLTIGHSSGSFTGNLVDIALSAASSHDNYMRDVALIGPSGIGGSADFVFTEGTYGTVLDHVHWTNYNNGVVMTTKGTSAGIGGGGLLTMIAPQFDGASNGAPILNPTVSVTIINPKVESAASSAAAFIAHDITGAAKPEAISVIGGWFGDCNSGSKWIDADGSGYSVTGVFAQNPANVSFIAASGAVSGVSMHGNTFFGGGWGFNAGASTAHTSIDINGNACLGTSGTGSQIKEDHTVGASYAIAQNGTGGHSKWRADIDCLTAPTTSSGGFTSFQSDTAIRFGNGYTFSTGSQNALIEWDVELSAGTWSMDLWYVKDSDQGIYTVSLDGTSIGTIDGYAAAISRNNKTTLTGINVPLSGSHKVRLTMATKGSGSAYAGSPEWISFQRTA